MNAASIKQILSVAALGLTAALPVQAAAASVDETVVQATALPTEKVSFYRAELATEEGRKNVQRRIERAAKKVCGSQRLREVGSMGRLTRNKACYEGAVAQAMSQVGTDQVASID